MQNGLYKIEFETQRGAGNGVVYLRDGKLWGGDSGFYYVGAYALEGGKFTASVRISNHTKYEGITSVFGVDSADIEFKGELKPNKIKTRGTSRQAPGVTFKADLRKLGD
jgi:hypothetical protein